MRASELFGLHVFDHEGRHIGDVHDVRVRREPVAPAAEVLTLDALVVGPGAVGIRLGYADGGTNGPWILKQLFRRRSQRLRIVPWDSIARRLPGEIHIYGEGRTTSPRKAGNDRRTRRPRRLGATRHSPRDVGMGRVTTLAQGHEHRPR